MKEGVGDAEVHAGVLTKEDAEVQQAGVWEDELLALMLKMYVIRKDVPAFPGAGVPDTERSLGLPAAKISPMPAGGPLEGSDGAEGGRGALARTDAVPPPDEVPPPETFPPTVGADLSFVWTSSVM